MAVFKRKRLLGINILTDMLAVCEERLTELVDSVESLKGRVERIEEDQNSIPVAGTPLDRSTGTVYTAQTNGIVTISAGCAGTYIGKGTLYVNDVKIGSCSGGPCSSKSVDFEVDKGAQWKVVNGSHPWAWCKVKWTPYY